MSRASDLRDGIVTELSTRLSGQTVEAFVVPNYEREDLVVGPRIVVRFGGREIQVDQGPDSRLITIEVGVIGVTPQKSTSTLTTYRQEELAACDTFDTLMESVIALWTPAGELGQKGIAEHRFVRLEQVMQFDVEKLYNDGVWLSLIRLIYEDTVDD